jgi:ribonuclease HI
MDSLMSIKYHPQADDVKGKHELVTDYKALKRNLEHLKQPRLWTKPAQGTVKLNIDGSYFEKYGNGGAGIILRDDLGAIIFSACSYLSSCSSPLEAELVACYEGIAGTREHTASPCVMEMDCTEDVHMLNSPKVDRSKLTHIVEEIKRMIQLDPRFQLLHIDRSQNRASHLLANYGRSTATYVIWIRTGPENVVQCCLQEASPVA